jgi:poly(beta-D-mannuronate) C5 epimerase
MFRAPRYLTVVLLVALLAVLSFQRFHKTIMGVGSEISENWKFLNGDISARASNNDYAVAIEMARAASERPPLPDVSGYTVERIAAMAPAPHDGKVAFSEMTGIPALREFAKDDGRIQHQRLVQNTVDPLVLIIESGDYDLPRLYEAVKGLSSRDEIMHRDGDTYTLRYPLLIKGGASLTVSGAELRLSQDGSSFIANSGDLYILHARVTGWNEKAGKPSRFKDKRTYRPFIVTWSGSHLYTAGSTISSLGYLKGKSYGFSYSNCSFCLREDPTLPRPTGAVVGNTFTDMYYGFYSYEADDVAIVSNIYANNVIYGIDPHDRSRRLIIAKNEAYGTGKKHGIIVSREVNDSWIFGNYSHDNHGSGIMIDRTSVRNIVADNVCAYNKADGITFFESQDNQTWGNKVFKNGVSGIRVRNSWNVKLMHDRVSDNASVPIVVYSTSLEQKELGRNFDEDPYTRRAGAEVHGTYLKTSDRKPSFKVSGIEHLVLSDIKFISSGPVFATPIVSDESILKAALDDGRKQVAVLKETFMLRFMQRLKEWF